MDLDPNNKTREMTNAFSSHNHLKKVLNDKVFFILDMRPISIEIPKGKITSNQNLFDLLDSS